jgi:hypothetical protein
MRSPESTPVAWPPGKLDAGGSGAIGRRRRCGPSSANWFLPTWKPSMGGCGMAGVGPPSGGRRRCRSLGRSTTVASAENPPRRRDGDGWIDDASGGSGGMRLVGRKRKQGVCCGDEYGGMRRISLRALSRSRIRGVPCQAPRSGALPHLAGRRGVRTNLRAKHAEPNPAAVPERRREGARAPRGARGARRLGLGGMRPPGRAGGFGAGAAVAIGTDGEGGKAAVRAWRGRWVWERAASRA